MSKHDEYFNKYILRVPQKTKKVVKEGYMVLDNKSINALRTKKGGIIKEVIDFLYTKKGRPKKGWLLKCIGNEVPIEKYNHIKEIVDNYSNKSYNRRQRDFILHNKKKRVSKEEKSDTIKKLQDMGVLTIDGRSLSKFTLRKLKTHLIQNIST